MERDEAAESKEWFEHRSCGRKRRYHDRAEALRGRKVMSERLRIYGPCVFCGGYHIGSLETNDYERRSNSGHYSAETKQERKRRGKPGRSQRTKAKDTRWDID